MYYVYKIGNIKYKRSLKSWQRLATQKRNKGTLSIRCLLDRQKATIVLW